MKVDDVQIGEEVMVLWICEVKLRREIIDESCEF